LPLVDKYTRQATYYDHRWNLRWGEATLRAAVEAVPWNELGRVLDVGCGTGTLEQAVESRLQAKHTLVGVDIALPMLQLAKQKVAANGVSWTNSPAEQLPFQTGAFDGLICNNSFHYYKQPLPVLTEFQRVLRTGGQLVLVDWCRDFLTTRLSDWALRLAHNLHIHRYALSHVYSEKEMTELMISAGFRVESVQRLGLYLGWGIMVFRAAA
jgi:ubiquinone/menaquinone biosynthesis C-methylase UbiE